MTASLIGDGLFLVALPFQVLALTDSPVAIGIAFAMWELPQLVFVLIGGLVTDRFDRRRVIVVSDVVRGVALAVLGIVGLSGELELWHLYALVAVVGLGDALFLPAFGAIVPDVVPKDLLLQANSLDHLVRPIGLRLVGPLAGGALVASWGPSVALLADAGTFAVSTVMVLAMTPRPLTRRGAGSSMLEEMKLAYTYVRARRWLWAGLVATALSLFAFYGPWRTIVPFVVEKDLGSGAGGFSLILAAGGVGAVVASQVVGRRDMPTAPIPTIFGAWALAVLSLAGLGISRSLWQMMAFGFTTVAMLTVGQIFWTTLQQQVVPRELLGRVSGLDWFMSTALIPPSLAVVGPLAEVFGARPVLIGAGIAGAAVTLGFLAVPGVTRWAEPEHAR